jgi:hypothetical protein
LNPPSLLFSGYQGGGGVSEEDLSLGPSALFVKLSTHLKIYRNCLLDVHMDKFLKFICDQYYDSYFQIKGFCGGDIQQSMSYDFQIL